VLPTAGLATELLDDEGLEQLPEQRPVAAQVIGLDTEQCTRQTRVGHVEFRGLDQALQPVGMPRRKLFHEEDLAEQGQVVPHGRAADAERPGDLAYVDEACRLPGGELEQAP
jgi:hypothetical protein